MVDRNLRKVGVLQRGVPPGLKSVNHKGAELNTLHSLTKSKVSQQNKMCTIVDCIFVTSKSRSANWLTKTKSKTGQKYKCIYKYNYQ